MRAPTRVAITARCVAVRLPPLTTCASIRRLSRLQFKIVHTLENTVGAFTAHTAASARESVAHARQLIASATAEVARLATPANYPEHGCEHAPAIIKGSPNGGGRILGFKGLGAYFGDVAWCRQQLARIPTLSDLCVRCTGGW